MRRFVILGHRVPLDGGFSLNDLPGGAGRIDVLCRAIGSSLFVSHEIRRDVETILSLRNAVQIRIQGDTVRRLNPDERSTAARLKRALTALNEEEVMSTPGIFVSSRTLSETIDRLYQLEAAPIVLHETGSCAETFAFPRNPAFILSDHERFTDTDLESLEDLPRISLGPRSLHTSQCITIAHYLLDARDASLQSDLVLCHKVWGEAKAQLLKGLLEDFDISVNTLTHAPQSVFPMALDGLSEIRLMVCPCDVERAREIIADYFEDPIYE